MRDLKLIEIGDVEKITIEDLRDLGVISSVSEDLPRYFRLVFPRDPHPPRDYWKFPANPGDGPTERLADYQLVEILGERYANKPFLSRATHGEYKRIA